MVEPGEHVFDQRGHYLAGTDEDRLGNSYVTVAGTGDGLTLGVIGHVDEIGLIVTHIDDSGFLETAEVADSFERSSGGRTACRGRPRRPTGGASAFTR